LVYQGESFLMYVALADGAEVGVRGVTRRDAMARVPQVGGKVTLGLHRDDTVLIADAGD
jgi:putative spermidine/putrescine transport system ATP-binding protein